MTQFRFYLAVMVLALAAGASHAAKNVILMITDGRSYAAVEAAKYWRGSPPVYEGKGWTRYSMSTFSANNVSTIASLGVIFNLFIFITSKIISWLNCLKAVFFCALVLLQNLHCFLSNNFFFIRWYD